MTFSSHAIEPITKDKRQDFFEQKRKKRREKVVEWPEEEDEGQEEALDAHGEEEEEGEVQLEEEVLNPLLNPMTLAKEDQVMKMEEVNGKGEMK